MCYGMLQESNTCARPGECICSWLPHRACAEQPSTETQPVSASENVDSAPALCSVVQYSTGTASQHHARRRAGLALYLVYLLLEKALVGWVTILLELAVGVVLMGVKLYLDLRARRPPSSSLADQITSVWSRSSACGTAGRRKPSSHSPIATCAVCRSRR